MIDDLQKAILAKFNQNRNASQFKNELPAGVYPVDLTVSLLGTLSKDPDGTQMRRQTSGQKNILRYLIDNCSEPVFDYLLYNLDQIRSGNYHDVWPNRTTDRMNEIQPYAQIKRQGNTIFQGDLIIEDYDPQSQAQPENTSGLRIISKVD